MLADCVNRPSVNTAMHTAQILDFQEFRRRQALRDCGTSSRSRQFLWVMPGGQAAVAVFRPATPSAADALRRHAVRRD